MEPLGVVLPRHQEDLHAILELRRRIYRVPVLPRGSGPPAWPGSSSARRSSLDLSRHLDRIVEINPEARTATVEPGVILAALQPRRCPARFATRALDPASAERATLGGVIGNNATGAHSILYGMTADHLLSAEVILSDGSLATWGEVPLSAPLPAAGDSSTPASSTPFSPSASDMPKPSAPAGRAPGATRRGYRLNYLLPWSPSAPPLWDAPSALYRPPGAAPARPRVQPGRAAGRFGRHAGRHPPRHAQPRSPNRATPSWPCCNTRASPPPATTSPACSHTSPRRWNLVPRAAPAPGARRAGLCRADGFRRRRPRRSLDCRIFGEMTPPPRSDAPGRLPPTPVHCPRPPGAGAHLERSQSGAGHFRFPSCCRPSGGVHRRLRHSGRASR